MTWISIIILAVGIAVYVLYSEYTTWKYEDNYKEKQ